MADENELLESALEHHRNGRFQEASDGYQKVLRANPEQPDALYLFGCLAQQTGNYSVARDLITRALAGAPEQAEYHYALGVALTGLRDYAEAVRSYTRTVELVPEHVGALAALGDAFISLGRPGEAVAAFGRALQMDSSMVKAWYGRGCAENLRDEFVAARECFAKALELEPNWLEARHNLARAQYELGQVSQAFTHFQQCSQMQDEGSAQSRAMMAVIVPGVPEINNAGILQTRKNWADRDLPYVPAIAERGRPNSPLRVGYVSSFFHRDNWMKPVWGLINRHDRNAIRVHMFSDCAAAEIKHGYREHPEDRYFDTSDMSNDDMAEHIEQHGIDVLVDLNGYSNMRRLPMFARRLAPVVVGWFNMYATTGISGFDYLVGDSEVVRREEEVFYSEKILRVPGSYLTFDVSYPVPPVAPRPSRERPGIVFGALASQYKITEEVIGAWSRILRDSPQSSLLIKNTRLKSMAARGDLLARFQKHGIGAPRLELEGPEDHFQFLRAYDRIDVALDTFPYNGGTTTTEAIWQGVPVVAFYGDRWASRTSASILRAAGLSEFVADDLDGYVKLAVGLGNDPGWLTGLRRDMRHRLTRSRICDTAAFAQEMERIYDSITSRV